MKHVQSCVRTKQTFFLSINKNIVTPLSCAHHLLKHTHTDAEVKRQYWRDVEKANTHDKIIWDMGLNREGVI